MESIPAVRLVFVYNANSGIGNALLDSIHKTLDPKSYNCNLCAITFGLVSEHKKWKEFRQNSGVDMEFLHRDEFKKRYAYERKVKDVFPLVHILNGGKLQEFLHKEEINNMKSQEDLIFAVEAKLSQI